MNAFLVRYPALCFLKPVKEQMTWHIDQPLAPVHAKHKRKQEA